MTRIPFTPLPLNPEKTRLDRWLDGLVEYVRLERAAKLPGAFAEYVRRLGDQAPEDKGQLYAAFAARWHNDTDDMLERPA
jgi:hypothetical protein